ncbi:MAG: C1 family peptidase, partial [bacterium]
MLLLEIKKNQPAGIAYAITSMLEVEYGFQYKKKIKLSPTYLYCKSNNKDKQIYRDIMFIYVNGFPLEKCYPSDQIKSCCQNEQCPSECKIEIDFPERVPSNPDEYKKKLLDMKNIIYHFDVFVAGLPVFKNWADDLSQEVIPEPTNEDLAIGPVGGHAVCFIGYRNKEGWEEGGYFMFKNSWGSKWGDEGYGKVSYNYMNKYAREIVFIYNYGGITNKVNPENCNYPPTPVGDINND